MGVVALPQYPCYLDDAVVVFEECVRSAGQRLVPGTHARAKDYVHLESIDAGTKRKREISMSNERCRVPADEVSIRLIGNHHEDFVANVVLHGAGYFD